MMSYIKSDRGVSTIAAIMMIIILGILGTVFVSLLNTEQYGYLNYYESVQSFYNASAGVEWGLKQQASTPSPIQFAGGQIEVAVAGNMLTAVGTHGGGRRIIQVNFSSTPPTNPTEECESFMISDSSSYASYVTNYNNPSGGVGDTVYIKVKTTNIAACSGGTPTLTDAEIELEKLTCPSSEFEIDNVGSWSCAGPFNDALCTDYYEYTISFNLPADWFNTSASLKGVLKAGGNEFEFYETLTIGQGDCSSVKFYSDAGYSSEVYPWEFEKGQTYYVRVITPNLNNNAPNSKNEFIIRDFSSNPDIFKDTGFFTQNGTDSISCGGPFGRYDGSITIPNGAPPGGSSWKSEPVSGWYYNFEIDLENSGAGNCQFTYKSIMKITVAGGGGGGGGPLDEAASQASATKATPGTPDWHGAQGGNDQFLIKLINETAVDLVITGFELTCSVAQPRLKHVQSLTAANGWSKQKIWDGNQPLPTGNLSLNQGGADDRTIPANSYIVIDDFHFQANLSPGTFTLIVYFQGGATSTLTFTL